MAAGTTPAAALPAGLRERAGRAVWAAPLLCSVPAWLLAPPSSFALGPPRAWLLLFLAFLLAEPIELHLELRRHSYTVALTDVPLCAALFFLPTGGFVLVRLFVDLVTLPYFLVRLRRRLNRQAFNLCNHMLAAVLASVLFASLGGGQVTDPRSWLVALVAVLVTNVTDPLLVALAIGISQGGLARLQIVTMVGRSVLVASVSVVMTLIALIVADVSAYGVLLLALPALLFAAGYRAYKRFLQRHGDLGRVYEFSRLVENSMIDVDGLGVALEWLRSTFNATSAHLYVRPAGADPGLNLQRTESGGVTATSWQVDGLHERLGESRGGMLLTPAAPAGDESRALLDARGAQELMATCLRTQSRVLGFLELHDRQGQAVFFTEDDLRLLENLTSHLTAAIANEQLVQRLSHDANHDGLTGLPNRDRFVGAADAAIAEVAGTGGLVAVLLLDLDSFKDVNDSLGHDHGDRLLVMVGERLRAHAAGDATGYSIAARMGADEFALLCRVPDLVAAEREAAAVLDVLSAAYPLAGLSVHVGASVGIAVAPEHAVDGGALLQRADVALYAAKSKDQSVATYLPTLDQASVHRLQLVTQLREALDSGQVSVRYQPKVSMATRDLAGVEALVRWEHPQYGQVMPDDFVPLAERTGLIGPLTVHVLRASLWQCRTWLDRDVRIGVAVNLSVRNLLDLEFPGRVAALLAETGTPPELLTFEITESSVMKDPERSLPVLHRLHEQGIGLSIDDFGTGYSSLAYLRRLPVDEVKIDKVFVLGMGTDLGDLAIVRAIIELGHSLGLRVVAEGVEDELARDLLDGMDCDVAQGFLISRALPPDRLDAWLTARTVARPSQPGIRGCKLQVTG